MNNLQTYPHHTNHKYLYLTLFNAFTHDAKLLSIAPYFQQSSAVRLIVNLETLLVTTKVHKHLTIRQINYLSNPSITRYHSIRTNMRFAAAMPIFVGAR